jgi:hypothetical protein
MSLLDNILGGLSRVLSGGTFVGQRKSINFVGGTVADDPANDRVNVTLPTGGAGVETYTFPGNGVLGNGVTDNTSALAALLAIVGSNGAIFKFGPGSYVVGTLTYPANVAVEYLSGAKMVIAASATLTHSGPVVGDRSQHFDTSASSAAVRVTGGEVPQEWLGAVADGASSVAAQVLAGLQSLKGKGGKFRGRRKADPTVIGNAMISLVGDDYSNLTIEDLWLKHGSDRTGSPVDPGAILSIIQNVSDVRNVHVKGSRFTGNGSTTDIVKGLQFGYSRHLTVSDCFVEKVALEGYYTPGTYTCKWHKYYGNHAEDVGFQPGQLLSAYNTNGDDIQFWGNSADTCGRGMEQTGVGHTLHGSIFRNSTLYHLMLQSSTAANEQSVVGGNLLVNGSTAIGIADQINSMGKFLGHCNLIYQADQCFDLGFKANSGMFAVLSGNVCLDGRLANGDCYRLSRGGHLLLGETVARTSGIADGAVKAGSTTGTGTALSNQLTLASAAAFAIGDVVSIVGIPSYRTITNLVGNVATLDFGLTSGVVGAGVWHCLRVTRLATTGHAVAVGTWCDITGVTGTKTVTATSERRVTGHTICSLNSAADATVATTGNVAYKTGKWARIFACIVDDYNVIRNATIVGVPWSSQLAYLRGFKTSYDRVLHSLRGESTTGAVLITLLDASGNVAYNLQWGDVEPALVPWSYGSEVVSHFAAPRPPQVAGFNWKVSDTIRNTQPGPLAITADTTNGNAVIVASSIARLWRGAKITITGVTGTKTVKSISGLNVTLDTACDATLSGTAVSYLNAGGYTGWACTTAGTHPDLQGGGTNGAITAGTRVLTLNTGWGLVAGHKLTIAGVAGVHTVESIAGNVVTLVANVGSTVGPAAAVNFAEEVWTPEGPLA